MSIPALTILLVEDQASVRKALSLQLQGQGHRVIEAADGQEGLALFRSQRPDLVLMDVVLPGEDGYWAARQIRMHEGGDWTPIIFLSSRDTELDLQRGIEAGGDDYLFKPASPVVLAAKLHALTRLQRMRKQLIDTSEALREANERLSHLSLMDELTQLGNRRSFDEKLHHCVRLCAREKQPLSLFLCDVDHFKAYNDHHGHLQGDACLQEIAHVLRSVCQRPLDHAARYGGEEFALILPNTPRSGAMTFARALQNLMAKRSLSHPKSPYGCVTLSGGITTLVPDATVNSQQLVMRADQALYNAKSKGRNCFFSFEMQMDTHEQLQAIHPH